MLDSLVLVTPLYLESLTMLYVVGRFLDCVFYGFALSTPRISQVGLLRSQFRPHRDAQSGDH